MGGTMTVRNEINRLLQTVSELETGVHADLRGKAGLSEADRRHARNEIEIAIQRLSELREQLG